MVEKTKATSGEAPLSLQGEGTGVRFISLDLWLTLIRSHPEHKRKRAELFCRFFGVADVDRAAQAIRKIDLMANHINETTGGNIKTLELWMLVLYELRLDVKMVSLEMLDFFCQEAEKVFMEYAPLPIDGSVENGLQLMRHRSCIINILSNTGFTRGFILRKYLTSIGWDKYFDYCIFSDETGYSKPNRHMFDAVYTQATAIWKDSRWLDKKQVLHIGDNLVADVQGAANYGFQSVQFLPGKRSFFEQVKVWVG